MAAASFLANASPVYALAICSLSYMPASPKAWLRFVIWRRFRVMYPCAGLVGEVKQRSPAYLPRMLCRSNGVVLRRCVLKSWRFVADSVLAEGSEPIVENIASAVAPTLARCDSSIQRPRSTKSFSLPHCRSATSGMRMTSIGESLRDVQVPQQRSDGTDLRILDLSRTLGPSTHPRPSVMEAVGIL